MEQFGNRTLPKLQRYLYLPHLFSRRERITVSIAGAIALIAGMLFLSRVYLRMTHPVPAVGGEYTEGLLREPRTINPIFFSTNDTDRDLARLMYAGLIKYDSAGTPVPALAALIESIDYGLHWTVTLRPDLTWQDGETLNADDVLFTIKTIQNSDFKSPLRTNWQGVEAKKTGSLTIDFELRAGYGPFIENLGVGIIPEHLWKDVTPEQAPLHELNLQPVGAGPYRFDNIELRKDGSIESYSVRRNKRYHHGEPLLQRINFSFFRTEEELMSAWRRGTIDGVGSVPETVAVAVNSKLVTRRDLKTPRIFGLYFNTKNAPALANESVRRAIAHAVNREAIAEHAPAGGAIPTDTFLPAPFFDRTSNESFSHPYDVLRARTLLDEAGWNDDRDGIREKRTGSGKNATTTALKFRIATSEWPDLVRAAGLTAEMLADVGIGIEIDRYPVSDLETQVIRPRAYEILLFGQVYGREPDPFPFWHSSQLRDPGLNVAQFSHKTADRVLEEIRKTTDHALRDKAFQSLQGVFEKELPAIFLFTQLYIYLLPAHIQGVELEAIALPADRFNDVHQWYIHTKRAFR